MRESDVEHEVEFQMKVEEIKEHLQKIRAFIGKANQQQVRDQESILHDWSIRDLGNLNLQK